MDGVAGTVLGMRTFQLARPGDVDVTVYLAGVADRLAREINLLNAELGVPPVLAQTRWAAELPPVSGWEPVGTLDAERKSTRLNSSHVAISHAAVLVKTRGVA